MLTPEELEQIRQIVREENIRNLRYIRGAVLDVMPGGLKHKNTHFEAALQKGAPGDYENPMLNQW